MRKKKRSGWLVALGVFVGSVALYRWAVVTTNKKKTNGLNGFFIEGEDLIQPIEFDWDVKNVKHVFLDHSDRKLTTELVESVFDDPNYFCYILRNEGRNIY